MDFIYLIAAGLYSPVAIYRRVRHDRYNKGWDNRFGNVPETPAGKKCIWIHAVSVGEVNATRTIIAELKSKFSDIEILITTTTDTGFARATKLYGQDNKVCYFPFDFSFVMKKAFARIKPCMCILMELEVWPNFATFASQLNVPIIVANGRISDRSFDRYKLIKPVIKKMFGNVTLALAQTKQYADRFVALGCTQEKVKVVGSLKYDTAEITDNVAGSDKLANELNITGEKIWVAGGTGNNEEKIIVDTFKQIHNDYPDLRLVIVPRKPERFNEVAELIKSEGFDLVQFSEIKGKSQAAKTDSNTIILGDTMGDLRKFYSLASIIFVGRTLVPMGGSDMAEAAALGKCTIFGPYTFNFRHTVEVLLEGNGAILANDGYELTKIIQKCLSEPDYAKKIALNGQNIIRDNQGATAKTLGAVTELLTQ